MAPITLLSSPPTYITKEQHDDFQSSTPVTGDLNHEPVLYHLERGVRATINPAIDGFTAHTSGTLLGDLYVTETALAFFNPSTSSGFSITYPTISLHAISRQPISTQEIEQDNPSQLNGTAVHDEQEQPCVYCQLDENEGTDYENATGSELIQTKEFSIFPQSMESVQDIYSALTKCSSLFPSTDGSSLQPNGTFAFGDTSETEPDFAALLRQARENDTGQEDRIEPNLTATGRAQLARLEALLEWKPLSSSQENEQDEADRTEDAIESLPNGDNTSAGGKRKR